MLTKQSKQTGPSLFCVCCPSSLQVGASLLVPSSWKESVNRANSGVSHNYRAVSSDFHQQLHMWWSGRNLNESLIGVNQLQAPQRPPQHFPAVPPHEWLSIAHSAAVHFVVQPKDDEPLKDENVLFCFTPGFHKRKCLSCKVSFIFKSVYVHSFHHFWLAAWFLHLIRRAISSRQASPRVRDSEKCLTLLVLMWPGWVIVWQFVKGKVWECERSTAQHGSFRLDHMLLWLTACVCA